MNEKQEIRYRYFCILSALISSSSLKEEEKKKIEYTLMKLEDYI